MKHTYLKVRTFSLIPIVISCFLFACESKKQETSHTTHTVNSVGTNEVSTDKWVGKWTGPEGTFLQISGSNGTYQLIIQNLDGPTEYKGVNVGDKIQFERNNITETIHTSTGTETGMKWLADKSNCLTIRTGEGYCRD